MPERLIPISRKQHDAFTNEQATLQAAQMRLQTIANTILQGLDEEVGEVPCSGVRCVDGVYSLVIQVAEPPAQAETT